MRRNEAGLTRRHATGQLSQYISPQQAGGQRVPGESQAVAQAAIH